MATVISTDNHEQLRVRHHDDVARIELPADELTALLGDPADRAQIGDHLRELGYRRVTLDLLGFRSGSLNEVLGERPEGADADPTHALTAAGFDGAVDREGLILALTLPAQHTRHGRSRYVPPDQPRR